MKKMIALLLSVMLVCAASSCSSGGESSKSTPDEAAVTTAPSTVKEVGAHIKETLNSYGFKGVAYVTHNGEVVYQSASGKDEEGNELTMDSSLYIGSVSKQFCAAAIIMLRDQGKLSVDDTLDKYFPEYPRGSKITVKNMLTMRSGIPDMANEGDMSEVNADNSEEKNVALIKEWIFSQPLRFEPDTQFSYSNSNFFLAACIVEQISKMSYNEFVRKNIFEPLGMKNSGFVDETLGTDKPSWAKGLGIKLPDYDEAAKGFTKGAGDIVTNAADMDSWMTALKSGKLIKKESFAEMTKSYASGSGEAYGYGLFCLFGEGAGHGGRIMSYAAADYFSGKNGYNIFLASPSKSSVSTEWFYSLIGSYVDE